MTQMGRPPHSGPVNRVADLPPRAPDHPRLQEPLEGLAELSQAAALTVKGHEPKRTEKTSPGRGRVGQVPGTPGTSRSRRTCDVMGGVPPREAPLSFGAPVLLGGGSRRQAWLPT